MDRRLLRSLLGLLVLILLVGALGIAVWSDDALEPNVLKALQLPERLPREVNLLNPISGFGVAEDMDPAEEGYAAVTRVNEVLRTPDPSDGHELRERVRMAWVATELTVEDRENVLCSPKQNGCVARLWRERNRLRALAKAHQTLLRRYRVLTEFSDVRMELQPHAEMPLPEFRLLMATHRLWLGMQMVRYFEGESGGLTAVLNDLQFLRRVLGQADDLLTKIVVASMVVEALHVYAALMDRKDAELAEFPEVRPLGSAEASLESVWKSEFRFTASLLLTHERRPESNGRLSPKRWLSAFASRPFFKPNRSVNSAYRCGQQVLAATRLRPTDTLVRFSLKAGERCKLGWTEWLSNPIGSSLVSTVKPNFGRYTARLHDLRGLVTLVNLKRSIRRTGTEEDELAEYLTAEGARFTDPYLGKPVLWSSKARTLYFSSPEPRSGYHRLPLQPLD